MFEEDAARKNLFNEQASPATANFSSKISAPLEISTQSSRSPSLSVTYTYIGYCIIKISRGVPVLTDYATHFN